MREAKKLGVKTVLNLRQLHSDRDELEGTGLRYYHIKMRADDPEDDEVARFLKVVTDPANQPVLVHCWHGSDRTGLMVAIYRMYVQGWSADDALAQLPRFGYNKVFRDIKNYIREFNVEAMRKQVAATPRPKIDVIR